MTFYHVFLPEGKWHKATAWTSSFPGISFFPITYSVLKFSPAAWKDSDRAQQQSPKAISSSKFYIPKNCSNSYWRLQHVFITPSDGNEMVEWYFPSQYKGTFCGVMWGQEVHTYFCPVLWQLLFPIKGMWLLWGWKQRMLWPSELSK